MFVFHLLPSQNNMNNPKDILVEEDPNEMEFHKNRIGW